MSELEELYSSMTVEQLENMLERGGLTAEAESLCMSEINRKSGSVIYPITTKYGGIGRLFFLMSVIGLALVKMVLSEVATFSSNSGAMLVNIVLILIQVLFTALRYKNIGFNPIIALFFLVPIVNFVVLFQCLAYPEGYRGAKKFSNVA